MSSLKSKNILLYRNSDSRYWSRRPAPTEGRFAIVTMRRAWDAMDAGASARCKSRGRKRLQRTGKSCGPGAATLALPAGACSRTTGARKAASPGRARISRKTIARGKPGCLGCTCSLTRVLSFATFAHGTAGAVGARLSLRPLTQRDNEVAEPGRESSRGNADACFTPSLRGAKRGSNPSCPEQEAGLLRFARNDGCAL